MRPDPRCPSCNEKVSATATWCMHCGVDFDEPVDAGDGTVTIQRERESEREAAVAAATRGASSADAGYEERARTPDAVEATQHHESGTEAPGLVESVTGGDDEATASVLAPLFAFLDRGQWRRLAVIAALCLSLVALVDSATAELTWAVAAASLLLGVVLLRKVSARETVATGATGAALVVFAVLGFDAVSLAVTAGVGSAAQSLLAAWPAPPVAVGLLALGRSLDR